MRTRLTAAGRDGWPCWPWPALAVLAGTGRGQGPGGEPQVPREGGTPLAGGVERAGDRAEHPRWAACRPGRRPRACCRSRSPTRSRAGSSRTWASCSASRRVRSASRRALAGAERPAADRRAPAEPGARGDQPRGVRLPGGARAVADHRPVQRVGAAPDRQHADLRLLGHPAGEGRRARRRRPRSTRSATRATWSSFVTANLYLQAVTGASRIDAARAQLATAQALYDRAVDAEAGGRRARHRGPARAGAAAVAAAAPDLLRERVRQAEAGAGQRAIGIPLGQQIELTDRLPYAGARTR